MTPVTDDLTELVLNRTWRPQLAITGADGLPPPASAGNVLRPFTAVKLSLRIPPPLDGVKAGEALKKLLESDPPSGPKELGRASCRESVVSTCRARGSPPH